MSRRTRLLPGLAVLVAAGALCAGCASPYNLYPTLTENDRIYFVQGIGGAVHWGDVALKDALHMAGCPAQVILHNWHKGRPTGYPVVDDIEYRLVKAAARDLAKRVTEFMDSEGAGDVHVVAHSAGCEVARLALALLEDDRGVGNVVFLQPSVSSEASLVDALSRVRGRLYYTRSAHDHLLSAGTSVIGTTDRVQAESAGFAGFRAPADADDKTLRLYHEKVFEINWHPGLLLEGWTGDHLSLLGRPFMERRVLPLLAGEYSQ